MWQTGLPTASYLLVTTSYLLLATRSLLLTRYSLLLATHYSLLTTHFSLLTTRYSLLTTHYTLLTTCPGRSSALVMPKSSRSARNAKGAPGLPHSTSCAPALHNSMSTLGNMQGRGERVSDVSKPQPSSFMNALRRRKGGGASSDPEDSTPSISIHFPSEDVLGEVS